MSARTAAGKKDDGDAAEAGQAERSTPGGPKPTSPSRRTLLARMTLLLATLGALASLAFIAHYDTDTGAWVLPEVRFSINDLITWGDKRLTGIWGGEHSGSLGLDSPNSTSASSDAADRKVVSAHGTVLKADGAEGVVGPADDDVLLPLLPTPPTATASASASGAGSSSSGAAAGGAGGVTVAEFKALMRKHRAGGGGGDAAAAGSTSTASGAGPSAGTSGAGGGTVDPKIVHTEALELLAQVTETLNWAAKRAAELPDGYKSKDSPIGYTRLSVAETHILSKVQHYLTYITQPEQAGKFASLVAQGHQCSAVQQQQQTVITGLISMDICSEVEWYKLAQLATPKARTAVDVGGNKGYLASLFLSLWGGGGFGLGPSGVYETSRKTGMWEGSRNPAGYCRDGLNDGYPLYCPARDRDTTGLCHVKNEGFTVRSFDGSSYLATTINHMLKNSIPNADAQLQAGKVWQYHHHAVSDAYGTARFTRQSKDAQVQQGPGFEGGKLKPSTASEKDTEEVSIITIDGFLTAEAKAAGTQYPAVKGDVKQQRFHVDILKVDAEGNDDKVLTGARIAIEKTLSLFTFEGGGGVSFAKERIEKLDKQFGYSCYSTSRAGLFKWDGGCMDPKFMGGFRAKDKGNVFCANRIRAPLLALLFDALSFPLMAERLSIDSLQPDELAKTYIQVKPFCSAFPSCIAKNSKN